jgi:hypothetical protein
MEFAVFSMAPEVMPGYIGNESTRFALCSVTGKEPWEPSARYAGCRWIGIG